MTRQDEFMGQKIEWDLVNDRNKTQAKAEKGHITPTGYWNSLRASFYQMTDVEKAEELRLLEELGG